MNDKLKKILSGAGLLAAFGLGGAAIAAGQSDMPAGKPVASQTGAALSEAGEQTEDDERSEAGESEPTVTRADADRAGQAAIKSIGGGKVLSVEKETPDEGADQPEPGDKPDSAAEQANEQRTAYSVEVRNSDGSTTEVSLDDSFNVLASEQDDEQDDEVTSEATADAPAQR